MLQRLVNFKLNKKLFFNKIALVNHLAPMSNKKFEDGQKEDKITYKNMSKTYHKQNDIITFGLHRYWRRTVLSNIPITENSQILDVPGGTGLNTMRLLEKTKNLVEDSDFCVTVYDINTAMMEIGQTKSKMLGYNQKFVRWIEGDMQKLPFENGSFDTYLMFFGMRQNVDFDLAFKEAHRVLKPNGKIVIGDFCYNRNPFIFQWLYVKYIQYIGSKLFYWLYNDTETAKYLVKNVTNLPSRNQTLAMLEDAGFKRMQFKPLSWKIAGMYVGYKI